MNRKLEKLLKILITYLELVVMLSLITTLGIIFGAMCYFIYNLIF